MSSHTTLFGDIRSLLETQTPGLETWDALVACIDRCPEEGLAAFTEEIFAYCLSHIDAWDIGEVPGPKAWIDAWLKGSAVHAQLLGLVPWTQRKRRRPELERCSYHTIERGTFTMLSNNGDGYYINRTTFLHDQESAQERARWWASDVCHNLDEDDPVWGNELNTSQQTSLSIYWRGTRVAWLRCLPDITVTSGGRELTILLNPWTAAITYEGDEELEETWHRGGHDKRTFDMRRLQAAIPVVPPHSALPERFVHPAMHRDVARMAHNIPCDWFEHLMDQSLLTAHDLLKPWTDRAYWDGHVQVGAALPWEQLQKLTKQPLSAYFDDPDPDDERTMPWTEGGMKAFAEAVWSASEELEVYPLNADGERFESELYAWLRAQGTDEHEYDWDAHFDVPWEPERAVAIGGWTVATPSEPPPKTRDLSWGDLPGIKGHVEARFEDGRLRLMPQGGLLGYAMARALVRRVHRLLGG